MKNLSKYLKIPSLIATAFFLTVPCAEAKRPEKDMDAFISDLMSRMTLQEKIGQLNLPVTGVLTGNRKSLDVAGKIRAGQAGGVFGIKGAEEIRKFQDIAVKESRLGIPLIFGLDMIHGLATTFPIPLALASSWNIPMIERTARVTATEATAMGICWDFAPMTDLCHDPRWGRIMEGPGEDPVLGGEIAAAMVRGYQGERLDDPTTLLACVKHFALYGAVEGGRDYNTVDMSRQRMFNEYMLPYRKAVEAGAGSVMAAFNEFEGVPATGNRYLLTDILRDQWNFNGFVVSDYSGVEEMTVHGIGDAATVAARALEAGCDMDMVSNLYNSTLEASLAEGRITGKQIDDACRRILEAKYKLGLFDSPYLYIDPKREKRDVYTAANRRLAREAAAESMVLLKNEGDILPLRKDCRIALIGPMGDYGEAMKGMWNVAYDKRHCVSLYEGLQKVYGDKVRYEQGCLQLLDSVLEKKMSYKDILRRDGRSDARMRADALKLADASDVIVAAMGEPYKMSGEGGSRGDISIPEPQKQLLRDLVATGKPVVLVLFTARPLVLTWENENVDAILNAWFPGSEGGDAVTDVLTGTVNPSAKLPAAFPYHVGQLPMSYIRKNTGRPQPESRKYYRRYDSNYTDIPNDPLYPFGYGLSYTTFEYGAPVISSPTIRDGENVRVSVRVANTGRREGKEIVQLYIQDVVGSTTRPLKELKDFQKISLAPGESKDVEFTIDCDMLKFYNHDLKFVCEPGLFNIMTGPSSANLKTVQLTYQ